MRRPAIPRVGRHQVMLGSRVDLDLILMLERVGLDSQAESMCSSARMFTGRVEPAAQGPRAGISCLPREVCSASVADHSVMSLLAKMPALGRGVSSLPRSADVRQARHACWRKQVRERPVWRACLCKRMKGNVCCNLRPVIGAVTPWQLGRPEEAGTVSSIENPADHPGSWKRKHVKHTTPALEANRRRYC